MPVWGLSLLTFLIQQTLAAHALCYEYDNINKWQISVLAKVHKLFPFYLTLTREPIIIVKKNLRVVLSWRTLLKVAFWYIAKTNRTYTKRPPLKIRVLAKKHDRWSLLWTHYQGSWYPLVCHAYNYLIQCRIQVFQVVSLVTALYAGMHNSKQKNEASSAIIYHYRTTDIPFLAG